MSAEYQYDFLFTYWVILWTVAYFFVLYIHPSRARNINPLLALFCESVCIAAGSLYLLAANVDPVAFAFFQLMNFLTKIVPMAIIYKSNKTSIRFLHDSIVLALVFTAYNIYLNMNNTNIYVVYSSLFASVIDGTYRPLIMKWIW